MNSTRWKSSSKTTSVAPTRCERPTQTVLEPETTLLAEARLNLSRIGALRADVLELAPSGAPDDCRVVATSDPVNVGLVTAPGPGDVGFAFSGGQRAELAGGRSYAVVLRGDRAILNHWLLPAMREHADVLAWSFTRAAADRRRVASVTLPCSFRTRRSASAWIVEAVWRSTSSDRSSTPARRFRSSRSW